MQAPRSLLYVPAARPDRFAKAFATGADLVCLDLEDAVAPADKAAARIAALDYLDGPRDGSGRAALRINSPREPLGAEDLAAAAGRKGRPDLLILPKVQSAEECRLAHEGLGGQTPLCAMIETAEGLARASEIAAAPGVVGVMFGSVDFAAEIGAAPGWEPLLFSRSALVVACARAGAWLLDGVDTHVADLEGLAQTTRRARDLGFTGRSCIHPTQVPVIHAAFAPSEAERAWAQRVVEAFDAAQGGVALLDGRLIELPIARAARRLLDRVA